MKIIFMYLKLSLKLPISNCLIFLFIPFIFHFCKTDSATPLRNNNIGAEKNDESLINPDTLKFNTLEEINNYFDNTEDSFSTLVKNVKETNSPFDLDSALFTTRWQRNIYIYLHLKKNHSSEEDLRGLLRIIRSRNIDLSEKEKIFNSFPQAQRESSLGKFIKTQLEKFLEKEMISQLNQKLMLHEFYTINGEQLSLKEIRSDFIFMEFWASWCAPCRIENKELNKFHDIISEFKNLSLVAVSLDKDKQRWVRAISKDNLQVFHHHICDFKAWDSFFLKELNIDAIPFNILIDREGRVIAVNIRRDRFIETIKETVKS